MKRSKKVLAYVLTLCMVLNMVLGLGMTASAMANPVVITDADTDKVYFDGNTIGFSLNGLTALGLPDGTYRVAFGTSDGSTFTDTEILNGLSTFSSHYYQTVNVSSGSFSVSGTVKNAGDSAQGAIAIKIFMEQGPDNWVDIVGQSIGISDSATGKMAIVGVSAPAGVTVSPALSTFNDLYNTEKSMTFSKTVTTMGLGDITGNITFPSGLNIIDNRNELTALDNAISILGAAEVGGGVTYQLGIDTTSLTFLNGKGAAISMSGLPASFSDIDIVNDNFATDPTAVATDINFNAGTLTFSVPHFSNYVITGDAIVGNWTDYADTDYAGGDGTQANPYQIATAAELALLAKTTIADDDYDYTIDKYFSITSDIDLSGHYWKPIRMLKGNLEGNGKQIRNITVVGSGVSQQSFIGEAASNAVIQNIGIVNCNITGNQCVSGLVGYARNTTINKCYATGTISGVENVGGLVGWANNTTINNCYSTCNVTGGSSWSNTGGILGCCAGNVTITNTYTSGAVTNPNSNSGKTGGVVGGVDSGGSITNSYYNSLNPAGAYGNAETLDNMKSVAFVTTLNADQSPAPWLADTGNVNGGFPVLNFTIPAPVLNSAETNIAGNVITLSFDKAMANPAGKETQFSVSGNTVTAAALNSDNTKIDLTLGTAVTNGQEVKVTYAAGDVLSADNGRLATFTNQAVTNNVIIVYYDMFVDDKSVTNTGDKYNLDMAKDASGNMYVVYDNGTNVYYSFKNGRAPWSTPEVVGAGTSPAIAVDGSGVPHVAYVSAESVKYKNRNGGAWQATATTVAGGSSPDIDVEANGVAHVVYSGNIDGDGYAELLYASGDFSNASCFANGWYYDHQGGYYYSPKIKVDSNGKYHIVFETQGWGGQASWSSKGVSYITNSSYAGSGCGGFDWNAGIAIPKNAITLDNNGQAHIVFNAGGDIYSGVGNQLGGRTFIASGSNPSIGANGATVSITYTDGSGNIYLKEGSNAAQIIKNESAANITGSTPIVMLGDYNNIAYLSGGNVRFATTQLQKTNQEMADEVAAALDFNDIKGSNSASDNIRYNLALGTIGDFGTTISWANDNSAVATNGTVTRPAANESDASVALTATVTKGSATATKVINVVVKKYPVMPVIIITPSPTTPTKGLVTVEITYPAVYALKEYKIDNGDWINYTGSFTVSDNCIITAFGQDANAETREDTRTISNIDKVAPVVTGVTNNSRNKSDVTPQCASLDVASVVLTKNTVVVNGYACGTLISGEGTYVLTVTDTATNSTVVNFVIDKTSPIITGVVNNSSNKDKVTPNSTDADIASVVLVKDSVIVAGYTLGTEISEEGRYILTVTDTATNSTAVNFIIDKTAPVITLNGDGELNIVYNSTYTDAGSVVTDNYDNGLTATVTGTVDTSVLGDYDLTFNVVDSAGNSARQKTRTVHVVDITKPVITLIGEAELTIQAKAGYSDAGASATDNYDGDLTSSIAVTNNVNANVVGNYTVVYNVSDASGNAADTVTRTVHVVDTIKPVITMTGDAEVTIQAKAGYSDAGATASDNYDGEITTSIMVTNNVNANVVGNYSVVYNVTDAHGNVADTVTRTVHVVDTTKPVITLTGDAEVTIQVKSTYTDAGATAADNYNGDLTGSIAVTNNVNANVIGNYTVIYNVQDSSGNAADTLTRTVHVVDTTKPVITLTGDAEVTIQAGSTYTDAGSTVNDNYYTGLTATVNGTVNTSVLGDYILTFTAADGSGNAADAVTRTVHVIDTTKPIITILGQSEMNVEQNKTYTDAGATATDNLDGNLTSSIQTTNSVDTTTIGDYTVVYAVTDSHGNTQTATRTVHVLADATPPVKPTFTTTSQTVNANSITLSGTTEALAHVVISKSGTAEQEQTDADASGNFSVTFALTQDAENKFTASARDAYNNWSDESSVLTITEDSTAPVITIGQYTTTPTNQSITVTATTDHGTLNVPSHLFTANGNFTFTATDLAGNSTDKVVTITNIDKTAPTAPSIVINPTTATNGNVTVTITYSDDSTLKEYRINNNGAWTNYTGSFTATENCTIYAEARDDAGNTSDSQLAITNIDKTAPTITVTGITNGMSTYDSSKVFTVSTNDAGAVVTVKVNNVVITADNGNYTATLVEGNNTVTVTAADAVNNTATGTYAITRTVASGGYSGGGGAPIPNNNGNNNTNTNPPAPPAQEDNTGSAVADSQDSGNNTMVTLTDDVTADDDGNAELTEEQVNDILTKIDSEVNNLVNDAENEGQKVQSKVTIEVENNNSNQSNLNIPFEIISKASENGIDKIEVASNIATIELPVGVLEETKADSISVEAKILNADTLSADVKAAVGNNTVYDFNLLAGDKKISNFTNEVTISIPYTLAEGQNPNAITVFFVNDNGQLENMQGVYANGKVTFTTKHFSKYYVSENKVVFDDLKGYEWAQDYIETLSAKGIIEGKAKGLYEPKSNITRAEFATLVVNMLKLTDNSIELNFKDVKTSDWYYNNVKLAVKAGIIEGKSADEFAPNEYITREDAAVMLIRALKSVKKVQEQTADSIKFGDKIGISDYALISVGTAIKYGLIDGYDDNTFKPKANLNRAESATVMYKLFIQK